MIFIDGKSISSILASEKVFDIYRFITTQGDTFSLDFTDNAGLPVVNIISSKQEKKNAPHQQVSTSNLQRISVPVSNIESPDLLEKTLEDIQECGVSFFLDTLSPDPDMVVIIHIQSKAKKLSKGVCLWDCTDLKNQKILNSNEVYLSLIRDVSSEVFVNYNKTANGILVKFVLHDSSTEINRLKQQRTKVFSTDIGKTLVLCEKIKKVCYEALEKKFVTIQVTISGTMAPDKNVKNQRAEGLKVDRRTKMSPERETQHNAIIVSGVQHRQKSP